VRSLAELQDRVAEAIVGGATAPLRGALRGGGEPLRRLAVHQRHYEASLVAALGQKFPACAWLAGAELVTAAARAYVHAHPPRRPCIAEYGETFPEFLAERAVDLPYLGAFATLEWAVGQASIAIDVPALAWADLADLGSESLLDTPLELQPGTRYLRLGWAVDELMAAFLSETEPDEFVLAEIDAPIEIRGARGQVSLRRLDAGLFAFRAALAAGATVGAAAERAVALDAAFDPGRALRQTAQAGLVIASRSSGDGAPG
jgi:hypothetical protein